MILSTAYYWPIQNAYHPLNLGWNGCSEITSLSRNVTFLSYDKPLTGSPLLAIIGPATEFSKKESSRIWRFMENGGSVLLADDFGTGNELLKDLNVSAKFSKTPLADLLYYDKNPGFPLIIDFSPSPLTINVTALLLNRPSYIEIENSSQVIELASSSPFSFIDLNEEHRPAINETVDSYPVMALTKIGKGSLILVSDPDIFVNEIVDLYNNKQLFENLLKIGGGSLLFDIDHLLKAPLTDERITVRNSIDSVRNLFLFSKNSVYIQSLVVMILILGFSFEILRRSRKDQVGKHIRISCSESI